MHATNLFRLPRPGRRRHLGRPAVPRRPAAFYKLKAKYGGVDLSDAKRLKQLQDENAKLKRLLADTILDNVVLKALPGKS